MKNFVTAGILTIALLSSTSALAASSTYVLAKVNGHDVTKAELDNALKGMMNGQAANQPSYDKLPADVQKAFVEKYVEKLLIIDAAKKQGLENDPGITQKLAEAKDFLIQQKYLNDLVVKQKTDENLKKIYDDKMKTKQGKEEAHAEHILVKTEDEAKKIKADLDKGGDFEKLAKASSIEPGAKVSGGDLGYFTADQMVPEFSKAAFALKKGEVSQPVQTQFGWHLIKLLDKRPAKMPTFAESKPTLENALAADVIEENVKKLKSQAKIEYYGTLASAPAAVATKPEIKKVDNSITK